MLFLLMLYCNSQYELEYLLQPMKFTISRSSAQQYKNSHEQFVDIPIWKISHPPT